jgi:predicted porin
MTQKGTPTMKRSIVFTSLAMLAGAAAAQSTVNVSGVLKVALTHANGGTTPMGEPIEEGASLNDLSSAIIFSGKEDLGGGMNAGFELASFLRVDTGTSRATFWSRRAVVKLGGSFGEFYAGRSLTPQELMTLLNDPWYWDGSGANVGWDIHQAHYRTTSFIRTNNTVGYVSPNWGGLTLSLAAAAGEEGTRKDVGGSLTYSSGKLSLGLAHDQSYGLDNAGPQDRITVLTGSYDFGAVRPMVTLTSTKVNDVSYKSYSLAMTAPVGPNGLVKAHYSRLNDVDTAAAGDQALSRIGVGYQHSLSKRTNLFAHVSRSKAQTYTAKNVVEAGIEHSF